MKNSAEKAIWLHFDPRTSHKFGMRILDAQIPAIIMISAEEPQSYYQIGLYLVEKVIKDLLRA